MKKLRAQLGERAARRAAAAVRERLLTLPELESACSLLVCLSFGAELDTRRLVEELVALGKEVYLPRVQPGSPDLTLHRFPCALERLSFGLEQPAASVPASDTLPELALILGLAFDRDGYRLGYGGGYFDRFLAGRTSADHTSAGRTSAGRTSAGHTSAGRTVVPIGLSFEADIVEELPRERHDVPMRIVLTEARARRHPVTGSRPEQARRGESG